MLPNTARNREIAVAHAAGISKAALARQYHVSKTRISEIILGQRRYAWRCGLSVRAWNALKNAGFIHGGCEALRNRLRLMKDAELMRIKNLGKGTVAEIRVWTGPLRVSESREK